MPKPLFDKMIGRSAFGTSLERKGSFGPVPRIARPQCWRQVLHGLGRAELSYNLADLTLTMLSERDKIDEVGGRGPFLF